MPNLEEQSPSGTLLQKDGAEGLCIFTLNFGASWIESFHRSCQEQGTHHLTASFLSLYSTDGQTFGLENLL